MYVVDSRGRRASKCYHISSYLDVNNTYLSIKGSFFLNANFLYFLFDWRRSSDASIQDDDYSNRSPPSPHPPPPPHSPPHYSVSFISPLCWHLRSELRESWTGPRSTSRKRPFFENCVVPFSPKFDSLFIHFNIISFLSQSFSCVAWGQVSVMSIPAPQVTTSDAAINGLESHMYKLLLTN